MDTLDDGYLYDTLGGHVTGLPGLVTVRMYGVELSVTPQIQWHPWGSSGPRITVAISESPSVIDRSAGVILSEKQKQGIFDFVTVNVDVLLRRWSDSEMDTLALLKGIRRAGAISDEEGSR